jgi:hypothetical protein
MHDDVHFHVQLEGPGDEIGSICAVNTLKVQVQGAVRIPHSPPATALIYSLIRVVNSRHFY